MKKRKPRKRSVPDGVTLVTTTKQAETAVQVFRDHVDRVSVFDVESTGVNPKIESPVGKGRIVCFSAYVGDDVNFGNGPELFVDNDGDCEGLLEEFRPYFEDEHLLKCNQNLGGFDRHLVNNHGIKLAGYAGDTMYMARLFNPELRSYKLEDLSEKFLDRKKLSMKELFGKPKILKNGKPSPTVIYKPDTLEIHRTPEMWDKWVSYCCYDSVSVYKLRKYFRKMLRKVKWKADKSLWQYYEENYIPFGELLSDMISEGIPCSADYLAEVQPIAEADQLHLEAKFRSWAMQHSPGARDMNLGSPEQKKQFLFAPCANKDGSETLPETRVFNIPNTLGWVAPDKAAAAKEKGREAKPLKNRPIELRGLGLAVPQNSYTDNGWPSTDGACLTALAGKFDVGKKPNYGSAYRAFGKGKDGRRACEAINAMSEASKVGTLLANFIKPLQGFVDARGRVHPSVGPNTKTGRLSMSKPNGQNQPAYEKDKYGIRDAFQADRGCEFLVVDYSQLELRVMAHMAKCKSMIDAFAAGGDFHSRTAVDMYPHIRQAIADGKCLLEEDPKRPDMPYVKHMYESERRGAKVVNFSIAYGKTEHGLSIDLVISVTAAGKVIMAWYESRPEVLDWQKGQIRKARKNGYVRTLGGRYRPVLGINSNASGVRYAAERKVKNTPIQGGAADIVASAMIQIHKEADFRKMGWRINLQVHDEIIMHGPQKYGAEVEERVRYLMEHPFGPGRDLRVALPVDGSRNQTWFLAK